MAIGDFLTPGRRAWRRASRRHEVVAMRLVEPREEALPPAGLVAIEDAETGRRRVVDAGSAPFGPPTPARRSGAGRPSAPGARRPASSGSRRPRPKTRSSRSSASSGGRPDAGGRLDRRSPLHPPEAEPRPRALAVGPRALVVVGRPGRDPRPDRRHSGPPPPRTTPETCRLRQPRGRRGRPSTPADRAGRGRPRCPHRAVRPALGLADDRGDRGGPSARRPGRPGLVGSARPIAPGGGSGEVRGRCASSRSGRCLGRLGVGLPRLPGRRALPEQPGDGQGRGEGVGRQQGDRPSRAAQSGRGGRRTRRGPARCPTRRGRGPKGPAPWRGSARAPRAGPRAHEAQERVGGDLLDAGGRGVEAVAARRDGPRQHDLGRPRQGAGIA